MKNIVYAVLAMAILPSCSGLKTAVNNPNYDDVYFSKTDIDKPGIYGERKVTDEFASTQQIRQTRSYGQSYSDRLRNFGSSSVTPTYTPGMMYSPGAATLTMYPRGYYNPYMMYGSAYNPYGMGMSYSYNPYTGTYSYNPCYYNSYGYYNPSWYYWNQYYSPYYGNYGYGSYGSGNYGSNNGSVWAGSTSGTRNTQGWNGSNTRRSTANTGTSTGHSTGSYYTPSSPDRPTSTTWGGGSGYGGSTSGGGSTGGGGSRSTWGGGSGGSSSGGGAVGGTSGRRR